MQKRRLKKLLKQRKQKKKKNKVVRIINRNLSLQKMINHYLLQTFYICSLISLIVKIRISKKTAGPDDLLFLY